MACTRCAIDMRADAKGTVVITLITEVGEVGKEGKGVVQVAEVAEGAEVGEGRVYVRVSSEHVWVSSKPIPIGGN